MYIFRKWIYSALRPIFCFSSFCHIARFSTKHFKCHCGLIRESRSCQGARRRRDVWDRESAFVPNGPGEKLIVAGRNCEKLRTLGSAYRYQLYFFFVFWRNWFRRLNWSKCISLIVWAYELLPGPIKNTLTLFEINTHFD